MILNYDQNNQVSFNLNQYRYIIWGRDINLLDLVNVLKSREQLI